MRHLQLSALFLLVTPCLTAQSVPSTINYQGRLTDNGPTPAPINATVNMAFEIWDVPSGGTAGVNRLWFEPSSGSTPIPVTGGIFNVLLGASSGVNSVPISTYVFSTGSTSRYLQVIVNGEPLTPRQTISATGYANQAENAITSIDAINSDKLGGVVSGSWQRALGVTCLAGTFFNYIGQNGGYSCTPPPVNNLSPPVNLTASLASAVLTATNTSTGPAITASSTSGTGISVTAGGSDGIIASTSFANGNGIQGIANNGASAYGVWGQSSGGYAGYFSGKVNITGKATSAATVPADSSTTLATKGYVDSGAGVPNPLALSGSSAGPIISGTNALGGGTGVYGENSSTSSNVNGVYGKISNAASGINSFGVRGENLGTGSFGYGVYGSHAGNSAAVYGEASGATGTGVHGFGLASSGVNYGVYGDTNSPGGYGVFGRSGGGTGVYGTSSTAGTKAIWGSNSATSGSSYGVYGNNASASGAGVYGTSAGTSGTGVTGIANTGPAATGVYGVSANGTGVFGSSTIGDGIYGFTSSGRAGLFSGNVSVIGTLSKSAGSFKIDHPLDPENKYLYHSFVESPDMKNIYDGNVVTDSRGEATVTLPDWFESLNRNFRYQLTVIGEFAQAIVGKKIQGNQFIIRTNKPNVEVSWQVTGIRKDAYAEKHRIPVEQDKPAKERGFYLHPGDYGQPEEKGVEWGTHPEMMKRTKEELEKAKAPPEPAAAAVP